jgi:hypothetical protein
VGFTLPPLNQRKEKYHAHFALARRNPNSADYSDYVAPLIAQHAMDYVFNKTSRGGRAAYTRGNSMPSDLDDRIRNRAHQLWEESGQPEGREMEFWLQAEKEIMGTDLPPTNASMPLAPD